MSSAVTKKIEKAWRIYEKLTLNRSIFFNGTLNRSRNRERHWCLQDFLMRACTKISIMLLDPYLENLRRALERVEEAEQFTEERIREKEREDLNGINWIHIPKKAKHRTCINILDPIILLNSLFIEIWKKNIMKLLMIEESFYIRKLRSKVDKKKGRKNLKLLSPCV